LVSSLTYDDPYTFVDLDDAGGDQAIFDRQQRVFSELPSYAERSPSGTGLHIIAKGRIGPPGRKRAQIEVYSGERFMTMTGDVYRDAPIVECQEKLSILYDQMGGPARSISTAGSAQRDDDGVVIGRAMDAANGDKFRDLFEGRIGKNTTRRNPKPTLRLIDIIAFYTQNRDQIARIFDVGARAARQSEARRLRTAMTNRAFDRQLPEVDVESLQSLDRAFAEMLNREQQAKEDQFALPGFVSINGQPVYPLPKKEKGRRKDQPPRPMRHRARIATRRTDSTHKMLCRSMRVLRSFFHRV
jgi:hypothetical protein